MTNIDSYMPGTTKRKKWIPPESQPLNPEQPELGNRGQPDPNQIIADMMSGKAFDPYRQQTQEAMARAEANKRAQSAGYIARSGQVGQGMAGQISGGAEQDILSNRFDTMLNTKMAEQQMKQAGVGMYEQGRMNAEQIRASQEAQRLEAERMATQEKQFGMSLQEQKDARIAQEKIQQGNLDLSRAEQAALEKFRTGQMGLQEKSLAEQIEARKQQGLMGVSELQSRERMSQQQLQSQEAMARAGRYQQSEQFKLSIDEQRLAREAQQKLDQGRLDLSREEQAALDKFRTGQLELGKQEQTYKEKYGDREQMLAEKRADTEKLRQISDEFYQRGQIDLGFQKLDFDKWSFKDQHALQVAAQDWLEKYQKGQLSLDQIKVKIQQQIADWETSVPKPKPGDTPEPDRYIYDPVTGQYIENKNWIQWKKTHGG